MNPTTTAAKQRTGTTRHLHPADCDPTGRREGADRTRAPYRKPANQQSNFATGQAEDYDPSIEELGDHIHHAFRTNNKAALLEAEEKCGLLQVVPEGEDPDPEITWRGKTFPAEVVPMGEARSLITPTVGSEGARCRHRVLRH